MSTMGLRGVLAAAFFISTGVLSGMGVPSGHAATLAAEVADPVEPVAGPGLLARVKHEACLVSRATARTGKEGSDIRQASCAHHLVASR